MGTLIESITNVWTLLVVLGFVLLAIGVILLIMRTVTHKKDLIALLMMFVIAPTLQLIGLIPITCNSVSDVLWTAFAWLSVVYFLDGIIFLIVRAVAHKKKLPAVLMTFVMAPALFLVCVLIVPDEGEIVNNNYSEGSYRPESVDNSSAQSEIESQSSISKIIKNGVLQYPTFNSQFKYDVYDTYVEIAEYIGDNLNEVVVPATLDGLPVYTVKEGAFKEKRVKSIIFEEGIYEIRCDFNPGLESVDIPGSVPTVNCGFEYCFGLRNVTLHEGTESMLVRFEACTNLKSIEIPDTVTSFVMHGQFARSGITTVKLPKHLFRIPEETFIGCSSLQSLEIPETVTSIGRGAFLGCESLKSLVVPESVTEIGEAAFVGCTSLNSITIPASVKKITGFIFPDDNPNLIVYGEAGSVIARQCAKENVYFKLIGQ